MRRRNFIAGTAATAAMSFAQPICAQIDGRSLGIKRIAFVHLTEKLEGMTVKGRYKPFFGELDRLGYIEGRNLVIFISGSGKLCRHSVKRNATELLLVPLSQAIPISSSR